MKRTQLIAAAVGLFLLPVNFIFAATLDELNNPLLDKGQWRLDSELDFSYNYLEHKYDSATGSDNYYQYDHLYWQLSPKVYYGISEDLQFGLGGSFDIPHGYDYLWYRTPPAAGNIENKFKYKYAHSFTEELKWRPGESWEFDLSFLQAEHKYMNSSYAIAFDSPLIVHGRNSTCQVSAGATWVSDPQAGDKTVNNRPDLDGLLNPLLNQAQIKVYLPVTYSYSENNWLEESRWVPPEVGSLYTEEVKKMSFAISPEITYGIKDNLQVSTGVIIHPPSLNEEKTLDYSYEDDGVDILEFTAYDKINIRHDTSSFLRLTQRPHPQFEWYLQATYRDYKARQNEYAPMYENGVLVDTVTDEENITLETLTQLIGFTWITLPGKEGAALAADLDGLKHPLLQKNQLRLDGSFGVHQDRRRGYDNTTYSPQKYYELYLRFMYGLTDALQVYCSTDLRSKYAYLRDWGDDRYFYPLAPEYGLGLSYRPRNNFELYLDVAVSPRDALKISSYSSVAGNYNFYYDKQRNTSVTLGATVLW